MADDTLGDLIATLGSIDDDEIDWQNVRRTTVVVQQSFRYAYPGPVTALRQRLVVIPPDRHDGQRLVTHKVRVTACNVDTERSYDTFGNVILDLSLHEVEREVEFAIWIVIEREATSPSGEESDALAPDARLLQPSRLTRPDDALRAAADEIRARGATALELADEIGRAVHGRFTYAWGETTVATTAAQAWKGRVGVCQDYAHCMVALCRLCDLPARYVSGQLLGEGGTHAWVEVLVPHPSDPDALRAVGFDPTNDRRAGLRYLTIAVGRDYGDVPPTSGTFEAPYAGELTTFKRAAVTRVEYARPPGTLRSPIRR